jgi:hypothetical protein
VLLTFCRFEITADFGTFVRKNDLAAIGRYFAGWFLTAIAMTLGAPFWFDLLNKLVSLRSSLKPEGQPRGKDEEARERGDASGTGDEILKTANETLKRAEEVHEKAEEALTKATATLDKAGARPANASSPGAVANRTALDGE